MPRWSDSSVIVGTADGSRPPPAPGNRPDRNWGIGAAAALADEGLHQLFARQVARQPDAIALIAADRRLSYAELDHRSDAWAARLEADGVQPGDLVPIALPRSFELIITLLAVLKLGAVYALVDPGMPERRLREQLAQLQAGLVICAPDELVDLGLPRWHPPTGSVAAPLDFRMREVTGEHPCCVFFTSGTTGRPKGVLSSHRATSRLFGSGAVIPTGARIVMPLASPTGWDAFSLELWAVLLSGGSSVIVVDPYLSVAELSRSIRVDRVNTAWLTSSLFNMLVDEAVDAFTGIEHVLIGGERVSPAHVRRFLERHPTVRLTNGYGPVESTIFATSHRITIADCDRFPQLPLGRPVPGTEILVLNADRYCDVDEVGEICLAGDGLALGYLGDPELTAARFPVADVDGSGPIRLLRTGDLGRWDRDGLLHFDGRADRQIKVRGYRVEPAEVERQIEQLAPAVRRCRVVARRDEAGAVVELVAFCIPTAAGDPLDEVLDQLGHQLVRYQLPTRLVSVASFPLTAQGKLDEAALLRTLPDPESVEVSTAPTDDPIELAVAETFGQVLGRAVPPDRSFFELGGDSLAAGRVCARLAARLSRPVPISWFYQQSSVTGLAAALRSSTDQEVPPMLPTVDPAQVPVNPMQLVLLLRELVDPDGRTNHCLVSWLVRGPLDTDRLTAAIAAVHARHPTLRAGYLLEPQPAACPVEIEPPPLLILDPQPSVDAAVTALRTELAAELFVAEGEVWRVALVPVAGTDQAVFGCVIHHVAFDGWSESVLAEDLSLGYLSPSIPKPDPPTLVASHTEYRLRTAHGEAAGGLAAISSELAGVPPIRWPLADRTADHAAGLSQVQAALDPAFVAAIDAVAGELGVTRFVVLLAHWGRALAEVTGQTDFAVGVPIAQRFTADLELAIGCHLSMACIRFRDAALVADPAMSIGRTAGIVTAAFAAQDLSIAELLRQATPSDSTRPPIFQTLFAVQDNPLPRLELPGIHTEFLRQPYLDLPLELHAEIWPTETDGLHIVLTYQPRLVAEDTAIACLAALLRGLTELTHRTGAAS